MKDESIHRSDFKWPVVVIENRDTGKFVAFLKGMDGVIAQGGTKDEAKSKLVDSLKVMLDETEKEKNPYFGENTSVEEDQLCLNINC